MYDVIIIGAGVSGAAAARELSRYNAKVCVIEKEEDVCCGTSKANSAIVHAGYDAKEGSLMAKLNVRGNALMEQLSKDLDFPFKRIGSLVVCKDEEDMPNLKALYDRGVANGVPGLRILSKEEVHEMEPNLADDIYAALYAPSAGIVCPFHLNIALAENANANGVEKQGKSGRSIRIRACLKQNMSSMRQVFMRINFTIWSVKRKSILHQDAAITACLTRVPETM